jgi:F-type H+-transporting ATPase subunit b
MNIDWFTFVAQIVNFLLLVALLRWLLYDPIVSAMREREQRIAGRLEEANQARSRADAKVSEYEEKLHQLEQQREQRQQEARDEAQRERQRLLREAHDEVDQRRQRWREAYEREQEDFLSDLRRHAGEMGLEAARRTLSELAGADLEREMYETFSARLRHLDGGERDKLVQHLGDGQGEVAIRTAFDVDEDRCQQLRSAVREALEKDVPVCFEHAPGLICGLELDIGGYRFGWSVHDFLRDLDATFTERLRTGQAQ